MFKAITQRVRRLGAAGGGFDARRERPRDTRFSLRVPNPYGGQPWAVATVALSFVPHGTGETLRVRTCVDGCLRLPNGEHGGQTLEHDEVHSARQRRRAALALIRRTIERLPGERVSALTARRWRSWIDIQLSTAPLDAGAEALMPEPLRRIYAGGLPRTVAGVPRIGVWSGPAGGSAGGIARLALLQFDETDISRRKRRGPASGFNLNVSLAQVVEPAGRAEADDGRV